MTKIDFTKVEEKLAQAIHSMFVQKLMSGKETISDQAIAFYGIDSGPRPKPKDSVVEALQELEIEAEAERVAQLAELAAAEGQTGIKEPIQEAKKPEPLPEIKLPEVTPEAAQNVPAITILPTTPPPPLSPLFLLRRHLLWFKRKKVKNYYELVKTTKEEIAEFRKKETFNEQELERIRELLQNAEEIKIRLMKKLGLEDDTTVIERERKKTINKRFNIKDTWLPLH